MSSSLATKVNRMLIRNTKGLYVTLAANMSSAPGASKFETLAVTVPKPFVYSVELNRPDKFNAFNKIMWIELGKCFAELNDNSDCRVVVLSASGKHFTAGIDLKDMMVLASEIAEFEDIARKSRYMHRMITLYQDSLSALEKCDKPVIAAVHSACVGAGVDLITSADIRYCTKDAWFQVKEVDIGMAADVGTLQRLPKVIGNQSLAREWCFTGRKIQSDEAHSSGLISRVFDDKESVLKAALDLAEDISLKSPVAVQMTKKCMVYSLEHTNQEGLDQMKLINQTMLQSEDFINACMAQATKGEKPVFAKL